MASLNKVMLIGNLGQDPDVRSTTSGVKVANFSIATSETYTDKNTGARNEKTEWHRIVAWRQLADICERFLKKGSKVYLEGRLQTRSWDDQNGQKKFATEIVADQMVMLDRREGGAGPGANTGAGQGNNYPEQDSYSDNNARGGFNNQNSGPRPGSVGGNYNSQASSYGNQSNTPPVPPVDDDLPF